jgi:nicotinamide mononucleotide transporter
LQSSTLLHQILATTTLEWLAFVFSLAYVYLAVKENPWCWPVGLTSVVFAFLVYIRPEVRLYSEATLQVYYMAMSVYGWLMWTRGKIPNNAVTTAVLPISRWSLTQHLIAIGLGVGLLFLLGYFWSWMGAALPYVDAFTTAFSIIATYMVAQKIIENWLYWIVIDLVSIFMNYDRGLYLFALLFFIYCIVAVYGWLAWRRQLLTVNR